MFSNNKQPKSAPISFVIAAIPAEPMYSQIARASMAISGMCKNKNIIDNNLFPCHITLTISGTTEQGIRLLIEAMTGYDFVEPINCLITRVYSNSGGFIGVELNDLNLKKLHNDILRLTEPVIEQYPVVRPRLKKKWRELSAEKQALIMRFGSYRVLDYYKAHLSIAQVDRRFLNQMMKVAENMILLPQTIKIKELQIVDVGHENESWQVLYTRHLKL
jgi:hypothetical protein